MGRGVEGWREDGRRVTWRGRGGGELASVEWMGWRGVGWRVKSWRVVWVEWVEGVEGVEEWRGRSG